VLSGLGVGVLLGVPVARGVKVLVGVELVGVEVVSGGGGEPDPGLADQIAKSWAMHPV
jgi:hypothetical protein